MSPESDNQKQSKLELLDTSDEDEYVVLLDNRNSASMSPKTDLMSDVVRSEVNFLVLPFFVLWDKDVKTRTETEFRAVVKRGNEKLEIVWNVLAHPKFGYPGPFDKRVHKAIEEIINELPRPIRNPIPLGSFRNLYRKMGFKAFGGWQYEKIKNTLKRIIATTVESKGAFYNKGKKKWIEDTFHLYERLVSKGEVLDSGDIADTNYLYLNSWYIENINANYVKPLDWNYYKFLKTPLAQRLYELLGVKFYGVIMRKNKELSYRYSTLCDLLPATRQKYISWARRILDPSHEKLKETEFLADYRWSETSPQTKGDWLITYYPGRRAKEEVINSQTYFKSPKPEVETSSGSATEGRGLPEPKPETIEPEEEAEPLTQEQADLIEKLVGLNVTKSVADDLVRHFDNQFIEKWTEAINYTDARDKAAYLVDAIRRDWLFPEKWLKAKEGEKEETKRQKLKQLEEERQKEQERKQKEEAYRLDKIYNSLSDEQRQEVDEESERRLPFFARERIQEGATDSPIVIASLTTNRREVMKEWLESGKIEGKEK